MSGEKLHNYSFGIGDRFGKEGCLLSAFLEMKKLGVSITPVWNKSHREHQTVGSRPIAVRAEADYASQLYGWTDNYLVDADHITFDTVDDFLDHSNFFTIDVASHIGNGFTQTQKDLFVSDYHQYLGKLSIPGIDEPFTVTVETLEAVASNFYRAIQEAKRIYDKIKKHKNGDYFSVELSLDEVEEPHTPLDLFFILLLLSELQIPINTIALKFTGSFNKGVDYEGDPAAFEVEFEKNLLVIRYCVKKFELPGDLKLSVHTGSDKFSLYPIMNRLIKKHEVGLHLKTAGTTWLEELTGLAEAGGTGLDMAKDIYKEAYQRYDELTGPYGHVLNIDRSNLPAVSLVQGWSAEQFANCLRHQQEHPDYSPDFRQLLHTAYKIAAEKGDEFLKVLEEHQDLLEKNVVENILERHLKPLFL